MAWREIEKNIKTHAPFLYLYYLKNGTTLSIYKICAKRTHRKLLFCFCNVCREYWGGGGEIWLTEQCLT